MLVRGITGEKMRVVSVGSTTPSFKLFLVSTVNMIKPTMTYSSDEAIVLVNHTMWQHGLLYTDVTEGNYGKYRVTKTSRKCARLWLKH